MHEVYLIDQVTQALYKAKIRYALTPDIVITIFNTGIWHI